MKLQVILGTLQRPHGPEGFRLKSQSVPNKPTPKTFALALLLLIPRSPLRAEDSIAYKFENYTEGGGRVGVQTQGVVASQEIGPDMQFGLTLVTDAIAGATPTGVPAPEGTQQVPLAHLSDHRKSWEADLSRQFDRVNTSVGISESREHDYVSNGVSLNTLTDFNQKNTTLLAGIAGHRDRVETFYDPQQTYVNKEAFSAIIGVSQLLDPLTKVTLNLGWARETGYLSDQYKLVQQNVELFPGEFFPLVFAENRPGEHNSGTAYLAINHAFPSVNGALEGSYRFYSDTYGVTANTGELRWLQKVGHSVTIAPEVRYHEQGAAHFYYYDLAATDIIPTTIPNPRGPAYSSDYRLSALDATTYGIKVTWNPGDRLQLDVAYDRYVERGRDGVTPQSAYPRANVLTFGAKISW